MIGIGTTPLAPLVAASHLIPQSGGLVTVAFADGTVLSVQPDGSQQHRPAGTAGAYELATVIGTVIVYNPAGVPFAFAYLPGV